MGLEISLVKTRLVDGQAMMANYPAYLDNDSEDAEVIWDFLLGNGKYEDGSAIPVLNDITWCGRGSWLHKTLSSAGMLPEALAHPLSVDDIKYIRTEIEEYLHNIETMEHAKHTLSLDNVRRLLKEAEENGEDTITLEVSDVYYDVDPDDKYIIKRILDEFKTEKNAMWWLQYSY